MEANPETNAERDRLLEQRRLARAKLRQQHLAELPPLRYAVPEAAAIIRKSVAGVYIAAKQGRIKIVKDGRRSYITRAELERYAATCDEQAA